MKTYYSWECPPRILMEGKWLDFEVDLNKVFQGEKLDRFTELPKCLEFAQEEKNVLKQIDLESNQKDRKALKQTNFVYYKIIADTNAYYLSPETVIKYGKKRIEDLFLSFKKKIEQECEKKYGSKDHSRKKDHSGKVKVVLFTELIKDYKQIYEETFAKVAASVFTFISPDEFQSIKQYLKEHVGFAEGIELNQFTTRVVASYIAEGVVIPKVFTNPVWINYDEPPCLAAITNRLNKKKGISIKNYKNELNIGGL